MHKIHFGTLAMTFPGLIMIVLGRWLGQKLLGEDPLYLWLTEFDLPWQGIAVILMMGWYGWAILKVYPLIRDENLFGVTVPFLFNLAAIFVLSPFVALPILADARKGTIGLVALGSVFFIACAIPFVASVLAGIYSWFGGYDPPER